MKNVVDCPIRAQGMEQVNFRQSEQRQRNNLHTNT